MEKNGLVSFSKYLGGALNISSNLDATDGHLFADTMDKRNVISCQN